MLEVYYIYIYISCTVCVCIYIYITCLFDMVKRLSITVLPVKYIYIYHAVDGYCPFPSRMHIQVYKWECALLLKNIKVDGAGALKPVQGGPDRLKGWVKTMMVEMNVVLISSQNYGLTVQNGE